MSKSVFIGLLVIAGVGYYLYRVNYFSEIDAIFDYSPDTVYVEARSSDLHDCKLSLTHDFSVDLPFLRQGVRSSIDRLQFKQWNGTELALIKDLGEKIEFKMRCQEGKIEKIQDNRYYESGPSKPEPKASDSGEVEDSH